MYDCRRIQRAPALRVAVQRKLHAQRLHRRLRVPRQPQLPAVGRRPLCPPQRHRQRLRRQRRQTGPHQLARHGEAALHPAQHHPPQFRPFHGPVEHRQVPSYFTIHHYINLIAIQFLKIKKNHKKLNNSKKIEKKNNFN